MRHGASAMCKLHQRLGMLDNSKGTTQSITRLTLAPLYVLVVLGYAAS